MHRIVHLYVHEGFVDWEPAFAVAGIQSPQFQRAPGRWQVRTVAALSREPVRSMGHVTVLPDMTMAELKPEDSAMLILIGGPDWENAGSHREAIEAAQTFVQAGVPLAAICGATAGLARVGLLDERVHTSNALAYLQPTGYRGSDRYDSRPAVNDGGVITAGGMSPIDFAHAIFAQLGIYDEPVLQAWLQLYRTGDPAAYARMVEAAKG